jgi:hypothetical protein
MLKNITTTTLIVLFLGSLMGYALFACIRGSGVVVEKEYRVDDYVSIHMSISNAVLHIDQAEVPSLIIDAEDNILERVRIKTLTPGVVKISIRDYFHCLRPTQPIHIYASMKDVDNLLLSGSGMIVSENGINTDNLKINISGSGKINLEIDAKKLTTKVSGSSNITLRGSVDSHDFSLNGSGKLEAYDFLTNKTNISISGSGSVDVSATNQLDVNISGSGKVSYRGNTKEVNQAVSGTGIIKKISDYFPANKNNILEALIKKAPELEGRDINITIKERENQYAHGGIEFIDSEELDGIWLATLVDDGWVIIHSGNSVITCDEVDPYGFPVSMIEKCYDLESHTLVYRVEKSFSPLAE